MSHINTYEFPPFYLHAASIKASFSTAAKRLVIQIMSSTRMLHRVALVRTDVSEQLSASFIGVTRIGELRTTLAVTSNRRTLRRNNKYFM
jgi:hypothetical protein